MLILKLLPRLIMYRLLIAALLLVSASVAQACVRPAMPDAASRSLPVNAIDQYLLDQAVRAEVNYYRCLNGRRALAAADTSFSGVARDHSRWMASTGKLSHKSNVRGRSTLSQRVRATGYLPRYASENLAMLPRYRFAGQKFYIVNGAQCRFAGRNGGTIPPRSYASLARDVVRMWMESPGHRRNILDNKARQLRTAAVVGQGRFCGDVWVTQNFIG